MPLAVITGASSPVGGAIARAFEDRGYDLILHTHTRSVVMPPRSVMPAQTGIHVFHADLSTSAGQDKFCDEVRSRTNSIDVLVHNAAVFPKGNFRDLDRKSWQSVMSLNTEAPLFVTQELLPLLEAAPAPCVINLTDCMANRVRKNRFAYAASKTLLTQLTLALSVELAPKIRVNAVAPGVLDVSPDAHGDLKDVILEKTPLSRFGSAEEIAKAVIFLACESSFATGTVLTVDGGRSLV